jgi:N-acyl homoserine lactone hydrolase
MGVSAIAMPLTEPLPGGSEDATVVVEPLEAGTATMPPGFAERQGSRFTAAKRAAGVGVPRDQWETVPIPAFLIRHPTAGLVLVDTGLHPSVASDPDQSLGRLMGRYFDLEKGKDVPSQLRARGVQPEHVRVVVMTHLHLDHASAISEFPNATFVISAAEWVAATEPRFPQVQGYEPSQYDFAFDYRTIDFDHSELVVSYGPLARTFDLFGDGSIRIAFTPGHSLGHQSVVCRLAQRDFVIAGDAVFNWRQMEGLAEPWRVPDRHSWERSLWEIQELRREYPYTVVVPGHDGGFWKQLEPRYAD